MRGLQALQVRLLEGHGYTIGITLDVLFPLVGWLIEGFEETPLTAGK